MSSSQQYRRKKNVGKKRNQKNKEKKKEKKNQNELKLNQTKCIQFTKVNLHEFKKPNRINKKKKKISN